LTLEETNQNVAISISLSQVIATKGGSTVYCIMGCY